MISLLGWFMDLHTFLSFEVKSIYFVHGRENNLNTLALRPCPLVVGEGGGELLCCASAIVINYNNALFASVPANANLLLFIEGL